MRRVVTEAARSAEVTHTHPAGVAGAVAVTVAAALSARARPPPARGGRPHPAGYCPRGTGPARRHGPVRPRTPRPAGRPAGSKAARAAACRRALPPGPNLAGT
ncbi:hypothetical protein [Streptomyces misionensis]|uniref:hypothetical protein n=1 Tax=Streptomyces misionensis TaxID=67331 RepID=UPI0037DA2238